MIRHSYNSTQMQGVLNLLNANMSIVDATDPLRRAYFHLCNVLMALVDGKNLPDTEIAFFYALESKYKYAVDVLKDRGFPVEIYTTK